MCSPDQILVGSCFGMLLDPYDRGWTWFVSSPGRNFSSMMTQANVGQCFASCPFFGVVLVMDLGPQTWQAGALLPSYISHWSVYFLFWNRFLFLRLPWGHNGVHKVLEHNIRLSQSPDLLGLQTFTTRCRQTVFIDWKQVSFCHEVFFLQDYIPTTKSFKFFFFYNTQLA